jgi:hypothetical protein
METIQCLKLSERLAKKFPHLKITHAYNALAGTNTICDLRKTEPNHCVQMERVIGGISHLTDNRTVEFTEITPESETGCQDCPLNKAS